MKVFVLIPVFNRLEHTRAIVECLRNQVDVQCQIVVVDDGSTDGTGEYLAGQDDIIALKGNGNLWWAGAIDLALRTIYPMLQPGDFFAFVNNDVRVDERFMAVLVATSLRHRAAVGSIIRDLRPPHPLIDIGPRANLWRMWIWDMAADASPAERERPYETYRVDFLSGRGTLYPAEVLDHVGFMRPRLLPHYHADYEFSDRVRRAGFPLLVASGAVTYSDQDFGSQRRHASFWRRKFGKGSSDNTLHWMAFFSLVGTPSQRWSAIPRMAARAMEPTSARIVHELLPTAKRRLGRSWCAVSGRVNRTLRRVGVPSDLKRRLGLALSMLGSSVARARVLAAVERRYGRRLQALHVYAAAQLLELGGRRVIVLGPAAALHERYFRWLGVVPMAAVDEAGMPSAPPAELVFYSLDGTIRADSIPPVTSLLARIRTGGVLYCACYAETGITGAIAHFIRNLETFPNLQVLANGITGWPAAGQPDSPIPECAFADDRSAIRDTAPPRLFAVRRLR